MQLSDYPKQFVALALVCAILLAAQWLNLPNETKVYFDKQLCNCQTSLQRVNVTDEPYTRTLSTKLSRVMDSPTKEANKSFTATNPKLKQVKSLFESECERTWRENNCSQVLYFSSPAMMKQHTWPEMGSSKLKTLDLRRVLLVIFYNAPIYESAAKLDALYRHTFADIVYCGPTNSRNWTEEFWPRWPETMPLLALPNNTKFVPYPIPTTITTGETSYECLPRAFEEYKFSQKQFEGALVMADDVVVNAWALGNRGKVLSKNWLLVQPFPRRNIFDFDTGFNCNDTARTGNNTADCRQASRWLWVGTYKRQLRSFYDELESLATSNFTKDINTSRAENNVYAEILLRLNNVTDGPRRVMGSGGDLFYVSSRYFYLALPFFGLLAKHHVNIEVSAGTVVEGITPVEDLQLLDTSRIDWGGGQVRNADLHKVYSTNLECLHPFKLSKLCISQNCTQLRPPERWKGFNKAVFDNGVNHGAVGKNIAASSTVCLYCNLLKLNMNYTKAMAERDQKAKASPVHV